MSEGITHSRSSRARSKISLSRDLRRRSRRARQSCDRDRTHGRLPRTTAGRRHGPDTSPLAGPLQSRLCRAFFEQAEFVDTVNTADGNFDCLPQCARLRYVADVDQRWKRLLTRAKRGAFRLRGLQLQIAPSAMALDDHAFASVRFQPNHGHSPVKSTLEQHSSHLKLSDGMNGEDKFGFQRGAALWGSRVIPPRAA